MFKICLMSYNVFLIYAATDNTGNLSTICFRLLNKWLQYRIFIYRRVTSAACLYAAMIVCFVFWCAWKINLLKNAMQGWSIFSVRNELQYWCRLKRMSYNQCRTCAVLSARSANRTPAVMSTTAACPLARLTLGMWLLKLSLFRCTIGILFLCRVFLICR